MHFYYFKFERVRIKSFMDLTDSFFDYMLVTKPKFSIVPKENLLEDHFS